jgi:alpha-D-xyloside xylohydrolase
LIREQLALRERIRPYVMDQMATASATGLPPMRALFLEFPGEATGVGGERPVHVRPRCAGGPSDGTRSAGTRRVPPGGGVVVGRLDGEPVKEDGWVTAAAPLERIPVYLREGGDLKDLSPSRR